MGPLGVPELVLVFVVIGLPLLVVVVLSYGAIRETGAELRLRVEARVLAGGAQIRRGAA